MKTRIITLLLAISVIIIGGATAQEYDRVIELYKGSELIHKYKASELDSIKFNKEYKYSVSATITPSNGGTVTINGKTGTQYVSDGGTATFVATPNEGYSFKNWTLNGNVVSTQNPYTAIVTANSEYVANFKVAEYRIKDLGTGYYLNAGNYDTHTTGTVGGVNVVAYAESDDQIFTFTQSGSNYTLRTKSGYNIVCQQWNVDALTSAGTALTFVDNGNGTYYIMNGFNYFKVEEVDGVYYPFCDAPSSMKATWILEQVGGDVNLNYTISVSSGEGGTATASKSSVQGGGSVTLTATPNEGYSFVNWTVEGKEVSTQNPYTTIITEDIEIKANFIITHKITVIASEGGIAKTSKTQVGHNGQVTLTATPEKDYHFVNWTVDGVEVSTTNPYTATITTDTEFKANFISFKPTGMENGKGYVDLGLSVKWATCNVGARAPEEYGDYFAWGETTPKITYDWSTYKYCNGTYDLMTKYCTDSEDGIEDNKTTLELTDDAARVNWGGSWRMPTHMEVYDLKNNCTWTWTTQNGVSGYKVTSKKNGNSIFLPAAGWRDGSYFSDAGRYGDYWSSSLNSGNSIADGLHFSSSSVVWYQDGRCAGQSVRAVCP